MTRSSSRARTRERGYVLISAIALAILYFGLMELMLIDSQRALRESQRFRSKVLATTLAENAAELAAEQITTRYAAQAEYQNDDGRMSGSMKRGPEHVNAKGQQESTFELECIGSSTGVQPTTATVKVQGRLVGGSIAIDYTEHSQ